MREKRFMIEGVDEVFVGFTDGKTWNGWQCPFFPKEEAEKVLDTLCKEHAKFWFNKEKDAYYFETYGSESRTEIFESTFIRTEEGKKVKAYPIGTWSWVWELAPEQEEALTWKEIADKEVEGFFKHLVQKYNLTSGDITPHDLLSIEEFKSIVAEYLENNQ